jgi:hypothetical protein
MVIAPLNGEEAGCSGHEQQRLDNHRSDRRTGASSGEVFAMFQHLAQSKRESDLWWHALYKRRHGWSRQRHHGRHRGDAICPFEGTEATVLRLV